MDQFYLRSLKEKIFEDEFICLAFFDNVETTFLKGTPFIVASFKLSEKLLAENEKREIFWSQLEKRIIAVVKDDKKKDEIALSFNRGRQNFDLHIDLGYTEEPLNKDSMPREGIVYLVYTDQKSTALENVLRGPNNTEFVVNWFIDNDRYVINRTCHLDDDEIDMNCFLVDKHCIREQTTFHTGFKLVRIAKSRKGELDSKIVETFQTHHEEIHHYRPVKMGKLVMTQLETSAQKLSTANHYPEDRDIICKIREKLDFINIWYKIHQYGIPDGSGCTNVSEFTGTGAIGPRFKTELSFSPVCCHFTRNENQEDGDIQCIICQESSEIEENLRVIVFHPVGNYIPDDDKISVCAADLCNDDECKNHTYEEIGDVLPTKMEEIKDDDDDDDTMDVESLIKEEILRKLKL